jgi:hypothetical protein
MRILRIRGMELRRKRRREGRREESPDVRKDGAERLESEGVEMGLYIEEESHQLISPSERL